MRSLLIIFILCICTKGISQNKFFGTIISNEEPLVGVVISYDENKKSTLTNTEGYFEFYSPKDSIRISVQSFGFKTIQTTIHSNIDKIIQLTERLEALIDPVLVSETYPITQTKIYEKELAKENLGQDIPILLTQQPAVVSTSDAGTGIGYTNIRVRGSDASRVNVTINGVPLNDSESQGVFWVNMPDFISSTESITLVRGVGSSTNGAGAFGASLHLNTEKPARDSFFEYSGSLGSFNTFKNTFKLGMGERNGWNATARLSKIKSDGYVDRASANLQSYFVEVSKNFGNDVSQKREIRFITFAGKEKTYQAWYGVTEDQLHTDRTYNPYTYPNQIDNYNQNHYQLLYLQNINSFWGLKFGLHYTKGKGYFEEYREQDQFENYGLSPVIIADSLITSTDLVRRRWLDNDFVGLISSVKWEKDKKSLLLGGSANNYLGNHYGQIIQGTFIPQNELLKNYYQNDATKKDATIYTKFESNIETELGEIRPFLDLQYRTVRYDFVGLALDGNGQVETLPQSVNHGFFNPKVGISGQRHNMDWFISFARGQKEPNRSDYVDSPSDLLPKPERMDDWETGFSYNPGPYSLGINTYFMNYIDQLALTGGVNDVGEYTRVNVDKSYRLGVETVFTYALEQVPLSISMNGNWSKNKIKSFTERLDNYDTGIADLIYHNNTDLALSPSMILGSQVSYSVRPWLTTVWASKYVGKQYLDNTSNTSRSLDPYFLNDISISANLHQLTPFGDKFEIFVLARNIANSLYESNGYTYGYIYDDQAIYENYYYPQAGFQIFSGITVRF